MPWPLPDPTTEGSAARRLRRLPKVLLHEHLDGGLRPATLLELLRARGLASPADDAQALARWFDARAHAGSLGEYLRGFALTVAAMATPEHLVRVAREAAEDAPDDIERISRSFLDFQETPESKIVPNAAFGYWKVTVERPLRLHSQLSLKAIEALRFASGDEELRSTLYDEFGDDLFGNFGQVAAALEKRLSEWGR